MLASNSICLIRLVSVSILDIIKFRLIILGLMIGLIGLGIIRLGMISISLTSICLIGPKLDLV